MNWSGIGAIALGLAVLTGAFGAHALRDRLDARTLDVWEKAVFYHVIHAAGLLIVPIFAKSGMLRSSTATRVCWMLAVGVLLFSGSLYTLSLSGVRLLGAVTPVGGIAFIGAWLLLGWGLFTHR